MVNLEFVYGLAAGLAVAGALFWGLRWQSQRVAGSEPPPEGAMFSRFAESATPSAAGFGPLDGPVHLAALAGALATPGAALSARAVSSELFEADIPAQVGLTFPRPARDVAPTRSVPKSTLRLSQRVILHIYSNGDLPPGAVAPPGLCQAGIVEALGIPQAGLAAVLRRLEAAGILVTERGHVRGHDRRLKIYRLSTRGLELARELRSRPRPPPGIVQ
ncbi:MAG: MarR family winged helix-turn-helix transcriptional regulator [Thermoplasmata archaeon]|nr:MarR family winged helix-turn-helix transcriptional regulator [Thermoplasmata archaeon]